MVLIIFFNDRPKLNCVEKVPDKFWKKIWFSERIDLNIHGALCVDLRTRFNITSLTLIWVGFFGFVLQWG